MDQFSWFGPSLIGLAVVGWLSHPLEQAFDFDLTTKQRWLRGLARVVMGCLVVLLISSLSDFSRVKGDEHGPDIPYSF